MDSPKNDNKGIPNFMDFLKFTHAQKQQEELVDGFKQIAIAAKLFYDSLINVGFDEIDAFNFTKSLFISIIVNPREED